MSFDERVKLAEQQDNAGKYFNQCLTNAWENTFGTVGKRPVGYRGPSKWMRIRLQNLDLEISRKITRQQYYFLHYMYCLQREYEE